MDAVTFLWTLAVFLASVLAGIIVSVTLVPKYKKKVIALG